MVCAPLILTMFECETVATRAAGVPDVPERSQWPRVSWARTYTVDPCIRYIADSNKIFPFHRRAERAVASHPARLPSPDFRMVPEVGTICIKSSTRRAQRKILMKVTADYMWEFVAVRVTCFSAAGSSGFIRRLSLGFNASSTQRPFTITILRHGRCSK